MHSSHIKSYVEDKLQGKPIELFHYLPTYKPTEIAPGEWDVDEVLAHRKTKGGGLEFLTKWEGTSEGEETWEPAKSFITKYCYEFIKYCKKHKIPVEVTTILSDKPSD